MTGKKITYTVRFRRRREGRTNYKRRIALLKSNLPRMIIRKTNKHVYAQIVEFLPVGDKVLISASSKDLAKLGWKFNGNMSTAYMVGYLIGKKANAAKIKDVIPDFGLHPAIKGSKIYAVIKGSIDSGLPVRASEDGFPSDERIQGAHVVDFFKSNSNETQFSTYTKEKVKVEDLPKAMEELKVKIESLVK